ncbi:pseudouridine synthase family protein [Flaviaesturariibacter terrae]
MHRYFLVYKPFNTLSQFTREGPDDITLDDLGYEFPADVYPVGRLDKDSEGLLLLTNDNELKTRYLSPKTKTPKTYWVQVEGSVTNEALKQLAAGVTLSDKGKSYRTLPAKARRLDAEPELPPRNPPIRFRKEIPTSWLELTIVEGKNRQVRRMTAAVGFPTLRLVRAAIGDLRLGKLQPGEVKSIPQPKAL